MSTEPEEPTSDPVIDEQGETEVIDTAPAVPDAAVAGFAPESVNLVPHLKVAEQERLANDVFTTFEKDWKSGEKRRTNLARILKLYFGELPVKEEGYSQIHFSLILKAVQRLHARIYDQQFPSNGEYFGVKPTDATDMERSVRVAKHMNWQIEHQIPEYVQNHDALIAQWYLYGSAFTLMYWDPIQNRPCHIACLTEDIVLPYAVVDRDPSMPKIPQITRILRKYRFGPDGIDALCKSGYYDKVNCERIYDDKTADNDQGETSEPIREVIDKATGMEKPESQGKNGYRVFLEQHRWWKFDGQDEYRPIIATIDKQTKTLVSVILREDEDPEDRARYNREKAANDASYAAAMEQFQIAMQLYEQNVAAFPRPDMTQMPMAGETTSTGPIAPGMTDSTGPAGLPPPPQMPQPPPEPAQPRMVPINAFTHYVCEPNPESTYGLGIGYFLEGQNVAADAMGSITVTQGKLSTMGAGIRSRELKMRGGEFRIRPGEFPEVDAMPGMLKDAIHQFQFPPPDPALMNVAKMMQEDADEVSGASDILSGEVGGSNETATTTQIRISQAMMAVSIQSKRYGRARSVEGRKLARLNSVHLGDAEYFYVVDPYKNVPGQENLPEQVQIGRIDYLHDYDITVTADPRMASQPQRVQEAQNALQQVVTMPPMAVQMMGPQYLILLHAAYRNLFIAMDRPDLVAGLGPPPNPMMMAPMMGQQQQQGAPQGGPEGEPPNPNAPPRPEPMAPPVPNAGPQPQNGAIAA